MTKADIAERISNTTRFTMKESAELLETALEIMKETLEAGEILKISGFGNFEVKQKANRRGRNPQSGEAMTITARRVLSFKSSQLLRASINK
ncbi:integration host factor subunit alpha [Geobacter sp. OR-1]|uniref:integration host factor subunit alpha n=1 Tax=Geobacter sp. OR-1 TaxID=1266765 RepID=UPI000543A223|nr:integration host factor subunit alpha [Geobacter sp. OR-1]GAM11761.1 integration host factor subunit alpha [Geobacter sp. OR-1]